MPLKRVTVTLPETLVAQLESLRCAERVSVSAMAEITLRAYLRAQSDVAGDTLGATGASLRRRAGNLEALGASSFR